MRTGREVIKNELNDKSFDMKAVSSYSELVRDMVDDEFELSMTGDKQTKIDLKPFELKGRQVNSLLQTAVFKAHEVGPIKITSTPLIFGDLNSDQVFNPRIDALIMH